MEKQQDKSDLLHSQFKHVRNWPAKKKIGLSLVLCIGLVAIVLVAQLYRDSGYQLLYGSLTSPEMATLSRWLDSRSIDYRADYEGGALYVSANRVHKVRSEIAEQQGRHYLASGHEVVDAKRLAPLEALDESSYDNAVKRELARTIGAFDGVKSAQVHLSFSHRGAAAESTHSATVVLALEAGRKPLPSQLQAIIRLVSGAVADLSPGRVRIISTTGATLLQGSGYVGDDLYGADTLSYQRNVEQMLENRALEVIEMFIGSGPAHVAVAADINFARSETVSERFDPREPVIRKEESSQLISEAEPGSPDTVALSQDTYPGSVSSESKLEYEINKQTSVVKEPAGTIDRLSVTLLLPEQKLIQSGSGNSSIPLAPEEKEQIKAAVSAVLALKPERGDAIYLSSIPMAGNGAETGAIERISGVDFFAYLPLLRTGLLIVGFLLAYLLLVRPIVSILKQEDSIPQDSRSEQDPPPDEEPLIKSEDPVLAVKQEVLSNPSPAAHIVRKWIKET